MRTLFKFVAVVMVAALAGGGLAFLGNAPADAHAEDPETRSVALDEGWNLAGWTGPDTLLADAIAGIADVTEAAATFDAGPQSFDTWNAAGPSFLNTLDTLFQGQAVWVLVSAPVSWVQPVVADPGALALRSGFNLVTWTGPSGLEPAQSFAVIAADLNAAFAFDKPTETFASFGPSRPDFLNDLPPLVYGDGFWVLMDAPVSWAQPAASAPAQVAGTDIDVTLNIPRGALPPGVVPGDISVTDGSANPAFLPVEGPEPLLVVQLEPSGLTFPAPLTLTAQVALPSGAGPFVVLISDDGVEPVLDVTLALDEETGLTTLAVPLPHFTGLTVTTVDIVEAPEFIDLGSVAEGQPFTVRVPVTRLDFDLVRTNPTTGFRSRPVEGEDEGWDLQTPTFVVKTGPLTPLRVDLDTLDAGPGERRLVPEAVFTCTAPGDFAIAFDASGRVKSTSIAFVTDRDGGVRTFEPVRYRHHFRVGSAIIGTCVEHPATFELLDPITFGPVANIFGADGVHIIVAAPAGGLDVRTALPITLTATALPDGEAIDLTPNAAADTAVIPEPAAQNCRGATGCSISIGPIPDGWVRLTATAADGTTVIAWQDFHSEESEVLQ